MEPIKITKDEVVSDKWYTFRRITFDYRNKEGKWESQTREVFDRGNGATILLYNRAQGTVILTRQFRIPTYLNGNPDGKLIETCAGSIEDESPLENIVRETEEETGYIISNPQKLFEAYMSPGAVTEIIHFFAAEYRPDMKRSEGGGKADEHENIEVLEVPFSQALEMVKSGQIRDGKTIMLLQYAQLSIFPAQS